MSDKRVNVLVLGGTPASLPIVELLSKRADIHLVTSILAREEGGGAPADGDVRIGGFADAQAMSAFVRERHITLLIDASDPFQADTRRQAAETVLHTGVTRLVFEPAVCEEDDDDVWIRVADWAEAADLLPGFCARAMLDVAHAELDAFSGVDNTWFLLRGPARDAEQSFLPSFERISARVGDSVEQEQAILRQHDVQLVVTREPLGEPCRRLLQAARALGLPALLLMRPVLPPSEVVSEVEDVLTWVDARLGARRNGVD